MCMLLRPPPACLASPRPVTASPGLAPASVPALTPSLLAYYRTAAVLQERQVDYVLACLAFLQHKYGGGISGGQASVVVIGHSMGGLVARAAAVRAAQLDTLGG